jgi:hypothetical protein
LRRISPSRGGWAAVAAVVLLLVALIAVALVWAGGLLGRRLRR